MEKAFSLIAPPIGGCLSAFAKGYAGSRGLDRERNGFRRGARRLFAMTVALLRRHTYLWQWISPETPSRTLRQTLKQS